MIVASTSDDVVTGKDLAKTLALVFVGLGLKLTLMAAIRYAASRAAADRIKNRQEW